MKCQIDIIKRVLENKRVRNIQKVRFNSKSNSSSPIEREHNNKIPIDPFFKHHTKINHSAYRKTTKLNKNCGTMDIDHCCTENLDFDKREFIGSGSAGSVYSIPTHDRSRVAMKLIIKFEEKIYKVGNALRGFEMEVAYSRLMADLGIGPKVINTFYYSLVPEELEEMTILNSMIKESYYYRNDVRVRDEISIEIQYIVMERFENSSNNIFREPKTSDIQKQEIMKQINELLKITNENGINCLDIKPLNFVINLEPKVDVKMIDFDSSFYTDTLTDELIPVINMKHRDVVYVLNLIQLYFTFIIYELISVKDTELIFYLFGINEDDHYSSIVHDFITSSNRDAFMNKYMDFETKINPSLFINYTIAWFQRIESFYKILNQLTEILYS